MMWSDEVHPKIMERRKAHRSPVVTIEIFDNGDHNVKVHMEVENIEQRRWIYTVLGHATAALKDMLRGG